MKKTSKILLIFIILVAFLVPSYSVKADNPSIEQMEEKLIEFCMPYAEKVKNEEMTFYQAVLALKQTDEYKALTKMFNTGKAVDSVMADAMIMGALVTAINGGSSGNVQYTEDVKSCDGIFGDPNSDSSTIYMIQKILNYIKVLAPLLVLLLSGIDFAKTVLSGNPDDMRKVMKKFGIRIACAVGVFLAPFLTSFIINFINDSSRDATCDLK